MISGLYVIGELLLIVAGIFILILCRKQENIVMGFFILAIFQMFLLLLAFTADIFIYYKLRMFCKYSYGGRCHENLLLTNLSLINGLIILCATSYSLIVFRNGRKLFSNLFKTDVGLDQLMAMENVQ
jgi:hypothetical protein